MKWGYYLKVWIQFIAVQTNIEYHGQVFSLHSQCLGVPLSIQCLCSPPN